MADSKKEKDVYDYGCIMADYDCDLHAEMIKEIAECDLYKEGDDGYGIEDNAHVTILYGLHDNVTLDDVKAYLKPLSNIPTVITGMSLFENEKFDVLKFDVVSKNLDIMFEDISENLDNTYTYDKYTPHMTIAYLKKGTAKKYIKQISEITIKPYRYTMSFPNDNPKEHFTI
ncbi:MAG: hypothetical protein ACRDD8_14110 [Bacteroidales bacterium]